MRWFMILILVLGAHFALTAIVPGEAGKVLFYWPFAKDSQPTINIFGPATKVIARVLSVIAGFCFLASVAALFGWLIATFWSFRLWSCGSSGPQEMFGRAGFLRYIKGGGSAMALPVLLGIHSHDSPEEVSLCRDNRSAQRTSEFYF